MKTSTSSSARGMLRALYALVLLAGFAGVALAFQFNSEQPVRFSQTATAGQPQPGGPRLFSVPGAPGRPIAPGAASGPQTGAPLPPMQLPPGQVSPGQLPPGMTLPGQKQAAATVLGQLPPAPSGQLQENPKLAAVFSKGVQAQGKGDWKTAAAAYREVLREQPEALPAHLNLGLVLMEQKQPGQAVWHLKRAAQIAPKEPQPRAVLAQAYLQLKQPREAYKQWTQLAEMNLPDNGQAAFTAGAIALEQLKEPEQAERWLQRAHSKSKGADPRIAMLYGKVLSARDKHSEASKVYAAVAGKYPKVTEVQTAFAESLWESGQKAKAISTLRTLEKSTPSAANGGRDLAQVRVMLGRALTQQKEYSDAATLLRSALEILPKKSPALEPTRTLLAQTLAEKAKDEEKRGQSVQALSTLGEAAALFPQNPYAFVQRGRILDKQGKDAEALSEYNRALKLAPKNPDAVLAVAQLEEKRGDPVRAMTQWKTLIETRPEYSPAYFRLAQLGAKQKQLAGQMDYFETRLAKNPDFRAPYDAILEAGHGVGRAELARDWVGQMAKKYPKAKAPRNALIAFERKHPAKKPTPTATPNPTSTPASTPTPKPAVAPDASGKTKTNAAMKPTEKPASGEVKFDHASGDTAKSDE